MEKKDVRRFTNIIVKKMERMREKGIEIDPLGADVRYSFESHRMSVDFSQDKKPKACAVATLAFNLKGRGWTGAITDKYPELRPLDIAGIEAGFAGWFSPSVGRFGYLTGQRVRKIAQKRGWI